MDINAEVSTQLTLIHALLSDLDKADTSCANKKNEKKEEDTQNAMPDSTTNTEKINSNTFNCGDDVLVPNKDGRYYLGTIVELSTSNDNDSCEVGAGVAKCLVKFGDGTHAWAPVSSLKLLSAPPADDGRIMCVVCKRREDAAASPGVTNAVIACDMCGRGYHAKCHSPPVDSWVNGASWHCKRCMDQRYRVAAAENRALKRSDFFRFKGGQLKQQQELPPPCDNASTTSSTASDNGKNGEINCYCNQKGDWLAQLLLFPLQMLTCCRCSRWFHQRCVPSLKYPLYAGDKMYIFSCANCNGGTEYLRRVELCWLDLAHLSLYNLTAYNAPNYFDLDDVIMPYIMDNWHALQLPEKMWRTPVCERRERILTALTSSRKRFKSGREMKKRATIWGLRLRRPPPPPAQLAALEQIEKSEPLTDELVSEYAPRLKYLPQPSKSDLSYQRPCGKSNNGSYADENDDMIVPVDGRWLNLMMGKRFHDNLNCNSENDSVSSYECQKPKDELPAVLTPNTVNAKDNQSPDKSDTSLLKTEQNKTLEGPVPSKDSEIRPCTVKLDKLPKEEVDQLSVDKNASVITYSAQIANMNLELSKLSTKNIIEHSKIMSLQHMDSTYNYSHNFPNEFESSGDESSSRGTLDAIIPPLKDFQGKNNPFLMQNSNSKKDSFVANLFKNNIRPNGKNHSLHTRHSLPAQPFPRPFKRKLSEKDIIIGPNGEVKKRKVKNKKPKKNQLNKSCPLPTESDKNQSQPDIREASQNFNGRRLRQRQEKNYYENSRRSNNVVVNNSVKSLKLSPHKSTPKVHEVRALKSSVQSYFRAGQSFRVLARRFAKDGPPEYLVQWDAKTS